MPLQVFALTFLKGYRPLVFHLPFWTGVAFGVVMQLSTSPCCKNSMNISGFQIGNGTYKTLLGFNVVSVIVCWGLAAIALLDNRSGRKLEGQDDYAVDEVYDGKAGVHSGRMTSLLGLPVPAFLRGLGANGNGGNIDVSGNGKDVAVLASMDPSVTKPPVSTAAAAAIVAGQERSGHGVGAENGSGRQV